MLAKFYPNEYLDSAYQIEYERLFREGYRGIIFDVDNTLVPHGAPADEAAKKLFARLKKLGYQCCLLSNNKEPRVKIRLMSQSFHKGCYFFFHIHSGMVVSNCNLHFASPFMPARCFL